MIITLWSGAVCLGVYDAESEDDARDQMARRNGYQRFTDMPAGCQAKAFDENEPPWQSAEATKQARDKLRRWVTDLRERRTTR